MYIDFKGFTNKTYAAVHRYSQDKSCATMKWWYRGPSTDEVMVLDLLFCAEAKTIYILDYRGSHHVVDYSYSDGLIYYSPKPRTVDDRLKDIKTVLKNMYGMNVYLYNRGHFRATAEAYKSELNRGLAALKEHLPRDILDRLWDKTLPSWCVFTRRFWKNRWLAHDNLVSDEGLEGLQDSYFNRVNDEFDDKYYTVLRTMQTRGFYCAQKVFLATQDSTGRLFC